MLLLAFGLRAGWVLAARLDPFDGDVYDSAFYHITALQLVAGKGYTRLDGAPTAVWPPGYPGLLALTYALSGGSVLAAKLANALFGALATFFSWATAARLFGSRAGLIAGALFAACPDDVFYANFLLSEPAFGALFTGVIWLFVVLEQRSAPGPSAWLALGAATGLAALTRGIALAWLAVPVLIWWRRDGARRPVLARAALAFAGLACVLLPWTLRNALELGAPVLLATSFGRTLAHAHGPFETAEGSLKGFVWRQQVAKRYAHLGQPQQEIQLNRAFTRLSLEQILSQPGRELALLPARAVQLFRHGHRGLEIGRPKLPSGERRPVFGARGHAWLAGVADAAFYALLVLGLLGTGRCLRDPTGTAWVVPLTVAYVAFLHVVLFPADPRYHVPVLPLLAVSAGGWLAERLERRSS